MQYNATIPAAAGGTAGSIVIPVFARYFFCISATSSFRLIKDNDAPLDMDAGRSFGSPTTPVFQRLILLNDGSSTNDVVFYSGMEPSAVNVPVINATTTTLIGNNISNCQIGTWTQFAKTVAAHGTAERFTGATTYFRQAIILAKLDWRTANTGSAYIGTSGSLLQQPIEIPAGTSYALGNPEGAKADLRSWWVDTDNDNDGIIVLYV